MKNSIALFVFLCLLLQGNLLLHAQQKHSSVFWIETFNAQGNRLKAGTGFFVDDQGRSIVHASLLEGAETARLKTADSTTHHLQRIEAADPYTGLVRFTIDNNHSVRLKPLQPASGSLPARGKWYTAPEPRAVLHGSSALTALDVPGWGNVVR